MRHLTVYLFILLGFTLNGYAQKKHFYLTAKMNSMFILDDGSTSAFWGYGLYNPSNPMNGAARIPGPTIEVNHGDSVHIHFFNNSPESHTIHLHGLDVNQVNDGVPATSFMIPQHDSVTYKFLANHTGTFLYHCHVNTSLHLAMGMYGMVTVTDTNNIMYENGPRFTKSYNLLASDGMRSWWDNPISPGPFHLYEADYFMINGQAGSQLTEGQAIKVNPDDTVMIRLANIGYSLTKFIFPEGSNPIAYMSDGRKLPTLLESDTILIYPGERYSIILRPIEDIEDFITISYHHMFNYTDIGMNTYPISIDFFNKISENIDRPSLIVYPNPASSQITVNTPFPANITIVDVFGRIVLQTFLIEGANIVNIQNIANGSYLIYHDSGIAAKLEICK